MAIEAAPGCIGIIVNEQMSDCFSFDRLKIVNLLNCLEVSFFQKSC